MEIPPRRYQKATSRNAGLSVKNFMIIRPLRGVLFYRAAILGSILGSIPLASSVTSLNLLFPPGRLAAAKLHCSAQRFFAASLRRWGYSLDHRRSVARGIRADQHGCKFAPGSFTAAVGSDEVSLHRVAFDGSAM